ncbi:PAQR family membrane homeostasis protein TrhA [Tautonia sociabilis]|uniref:Hemolysin III family protein n=1 Tax=Tautonia sociabilis TaxID=2080755 RepID=A0A432MGY5_9BACT|nr:hemolysin III family protein [Tautonia sociabilis]RUL86188.1 hemolysin III family protein [Tautonia sociabilis]
MTPAEELANALSHGLGLVAALVISPFLVSGGWEVGGATGALAALVFCTAMILVYLFSTVHHAWPDGLRKQRLEVLDRAAIFLLIAGTYTPFTLGVLRGVWGWLLFGAVWSLAVVGVVRTILGGVDRPYRGTKLYLAMGWLVLLVIGPVRERMHPTGLSLIVAGGAAYTVGVAFYVARRLKFNHLIWHLFVLMGSAFHVLAALWYSAV